VIAIDSNLLVYAHKAESPFHEKAVAALNPVVSGWTPWAIAWPSIHEFVSVATNPRIYKPASSLTEAFEFIGGLFESGSLQLLSESGDYIRTLRAVALAGKAVGARIHDARIAALCIHHGVTELWSADRDFAAFKGLRVRNPLLASS